MWCSVLFFWCLGLLIFRCCLVFFSPSSSWRREPSSRPLSSESPCDAASRSEPRPSACRPAPSYRCPTNPPRPLQRNDRCVETLTLRFVNVFASILYCVRDYCKIFARDGRASHRARRRARALANARKAKRVKKIRAPIRCARARPGRPGGPKVLVET